MFGYVTVNRLEMKVRELELYRSYYCGLCHALHERYGRKGQLVLSYDGTFLSLLLTGLYEPGEKERMTRCVIHPWVRHREIASSCTAYAADMNVMLAYRKAVDDWKDERKVQARMAALALHGDYQRIRGRYPRQEKALRKNLALLARMERAGGAKAQEDPGESGERLHQVLARIEKAAGYTGNFLGEMCVMHRDRWEADLRGCGFYLGKFIYLMDARDDLEEDAKRGSFNPLLELKKLDGAHFDETVKGMLIDTAACCCRCFERLPIVKNVELLRNILYSGIWVRYYQKEKHERPV